MWWIRYPKFCFSNIFCVQQIICKVLHISSKSVYACFSSFVFTSSIVRYYCWWIYSRQLTAFDLKQGLWTLYTNKFTTTRTRWDLLCKIPHIQKIYYYMCFVAWLERCFRNGFVGWWWGLCWFLLVVTCGSIICGHAEKDKNIEVIWENVEENTEAIMVAVDICMFCYMLQMY